MVPGSKNSVIRLRIAKPQTWTGETGSVTFSKKSYKCKTESIPVVNLRPDHTKHFKVTATPDNFTHYGVYATESVEIYVEGCTFAELTDDTTFQLYDSNNTLIQTSSFGFNPHSKVLTISLTPPQEYASGTGRIILQNVPAGLTCDDADSIFVQNLIPDTTTHYAILGTTVIDDLINNFTTSIQVQLSKPIAKALLDDQAQFHIMDKTNNPLPIMFSNAVASEDNTTVILTQSDHDRLYPFVDGDGALTIIGSPHYTCTTNTTTITGIHYDETIHYTAIAYPHNNGAVNQNTTSVDIQLTGVTADDIQNENAKFAVQL
ncbi:hypothetical protein FACS1894218_5550 [Bacilli bacterium]|nr:hypothetical protein FACS1894218_5550 [Bacilli bacterium]